MEIEYGFSLEEIELSVLESTIDVSGVPDYRAAYELLSGEVCRLPECLDGGRSGPPDAAASLRQALRRAGAFASPGGSATQAR